MPRIPRYGDGTPQARERALPVPNLDPGIDAAAFGAGLARGLGQAGQVAGEIAEDERRRADAAAVLEASTHLDEWEFRHVRDRESGALARTGRHALNISDTVLADFDEEVGRVREPLSESQAELFDRRLAARRRSLMATLADHERREINDLYAQALKGKLETGLRKVRDAFDDPTTRDLALSEMLDELALYADANGWSVDDFAATVADLQGRAHASVVEGYLAGDDADAARAYLDEHGATIAPNRRSSLRDAVRELGDAQTAERLATDAHARGTNGYEYLRGLRRRNEHRVEVVDAAEQRLARKLQQDDVTRALEDEATFEAADEAFVAAGWDTDAIRRAGLWTRLSAAEQYQFERLEGLKARGRTADEFTAQGREAWLAYSAMPADERAQFNIRRLAGLIPESLYRSEVKAWRTLRDQQNAGQDAGQTWDRKDLIRLVAIDEGVIPGDKKARGDKFEEYVAVQINAGREFDSFAARHNREPSQTEAEEIVREVIDRAVYLPGLFRDSRVPLGTVAGTSLEETREELLDRDDDVFVPLDEIPTSRQDDLALALRKVSREPTPHAVKNAEGRLRAGIAPDWLHDALATVEEERRVLRHTISAQGGDPDGEVFRRVWELWQTGTDEARAEAWQVLYSIGGE